MRINTNTWNKIRYTLYLPGYDLIAGYFRNIRKRSIDSLDVKNGEKVLIIGAGTGLDLEFLPKGCEIVAIDITPAMVEIIKIRSKKYGTIAQILVMDGQHLEFEDNSFDKIILHLVLAVIPDPVSCIKESERVLKSGGLITVFDKFLPKNRKISTRRRLANIFSDILFSNITRDFESIAGNTQLSIVSDTDAGFGGNMRLIKLTKR
ncbi:MAG: phosphatidylethanolamine N-methyltransferase [Bacteroidetes bacterium GWF2_40_14]|nr:MAG: phosphatidylethanolamine N-methyltransferase [Bacteroidetes bacterium GWF2_40_14]